MSSCFSSTFDSRVIGHLDHKIIYESSGIENSTVYPNRLYHINDSSDSQAFYTSEIDGKNIRRVKIKGEGFLDFEDLSYGPCGNDQCLYLGDIGDNKENRDEIKIVIIKEEKTFDEEVEPFKVLRLQYPDGKYNAEAMSIHPNGDLFILTKESHRGKSSGKSFVFKLPKEKFERSEIGILERIGVLNLEEIWSKDKGKKKKITSMDIHPNGKSFVVLSYGGALKINHDLTLGWKDYDRESLSITLLKQQEAICFREDGKSVLYTTESRKSSSPIYQYDL